MVNLYLEDQATNNDVVYTEEKIPLQAGTDNYYWTFDLAEFLPFPLPIPANVTINVNNRTLSTDYISASYPPLKDLAYKGLTANGVFEKVNPKQIGFLLKAVNGTLDKLPNPAYVVMSKGQEPKNFTSTQFNGKCKFVNPDINWVNNTSA